jgi:hypothetical protein
MTTLDNASHHLPFHTELSPANVANLWIARHDETKKSTGHVLTGGLVSRWGRGLLLFEECQDIDVDFVLEDRAHAVRSSRIEFEPGALYDLAERRAAAPVGPT